MARRPRYDAPGVWHHAMQRGAARRTVFEARDDMRFFEAQLAKAMRRGEIELACFTMVTTHCHMLVRSCEGRLSQSIGRILNVYARRFNRTRGRDGPLFRGRFLSKPVNTLAYRRTVVRYIDDNAVDAGLVAQAADYPWASALHYARERGPRWLSREWVESEVRRHTLASAYRPADYPVCFPSRLSPALRRWVERCLHARGVSPDDLDDMIAAAPDRVQEWMIRRAHLADGTAPGLVLLPPEFLDAALRDVEQVHTLRSSILRRGDPARIVRAGLMKELCGLSQAELAGHLAAPRSTLQDRCFAHRTAMRKDPAYAEHCARVATAAFAIMRAATLGDGGQVPGRDCPAG